MYAVLNLIDTVLWLYWWAIILVALMSWLISFNVVNFHNQMVRSVWNGLNAIVEPALQPIRRFLPNMGGLDISPVILLLIVGFLRDFVHRDLPRLVGF